jgi:hypothetical protein
MFRGGKALCPAGGVGEIFFKLEMVTIHERSPPPVHCHWVPHLGEVRKRMVHAVHITVVRGFNSSMKGHGDGNGNGNGNGYEHGRPRSIFRSSFLS